MRTVSWIAFFTCCLWMTGTEAQVAPSPPTQTPAKLPEPTSSTTPDNTRYLNDPRLLIGCQSLVAAAKDKPCDILFIGDSITVGWRHPGKEIWDKYYGHRPSLNFGIAGDKTQNVLWRMDHLDIKGLKPKVTVILIGTNNNSNTGPEIADGVKAVLAKTREMFPETKVILVSIMPKGSPVSAKMMEADAILKTFADDKTVYFLDLVPLMTPVGKNYKGLGRDYLHPDASGYQLWAEAMEPLLVKLLAEAPAAK